MKRQQRSLWESFLAYGFLMMAVGFVLWEVSLKQDRDDNDLWLVKNIAENHHSLTRIDTFVSVSEAKTAFDKSLGFQTNKVKAEIFEFRLIRDERKLILRTYGRSTYGENYPEINTASVEKAAVYGHDRSGNMFLGSNQLVTLPSTLLDAKSLLELETFYRNFGRVLVGNFSPKREMEKLQNHAFFWRPLAVLISSVSYGAIFLGAVIFSLGLVGLVRAILAWYRHEKETALRKIRQELFAEVRAKERRQQVPERTAVAPAPVVGRKKFQASKTPETERERLVKSVLNLTNDTVSILPEVERLLDEAKILEWEQAEEKLRKARKIQWVAFKAGGGFKQKSLEHSHAH